MEKHKPTPEKKCCWNCGNDYLNDPKVDCCDATCYKCHAPYDKTRCAEFGFNGSKPSPSPEARVDWENEAREILYETRWAGEYNDLIWEGNDNKMLKSITLPKIMNLIQTALRETAEPLEKEIKSLKDRIFMCKTDQYEALEERVNIEKDVAESLGKECTELGLKLDEAKSRIRELEEALKFYAQEPKNRRALAALSKSRQEKK